MAVTAAAAQSPAGPRFRVASDLVVVDLLATDRDGRLVTDLTAADIQVLQNGRPQKVEFVQLVRGGTTPAGAGPAAAPPAGASPAAGASPSAPGASAAPSGTSVAVIIDVLSLPADSISYVKGAIGEVIDTLPENGRMLLATMRRGLTVRQTFTADRPALKKALDAAFEAGDAPSLLNIMEVSERICDGNAPAAGMPGAMGDPTPALNQSINMARALIQEWEHQLKGSADLLGGLATSMAAQPGRKHVVLYSVGYAVNPGAAAIDLVAEVNAACAGQPVEDLRRRIGSELSAHAQFTGAATLQQLADRANRAQVSFYTVDPRGLMPANLQAKSFGTARSTRSGNLSRVVQLQTTLPQEFLRTVAADTGGRAFLNTNDLAAGLRRAWADASEYYLVGYVPASRPQKGAFHRIEVKVSRPNLDLRYRSGYYEATDKEIATREVEAALRAPEAFAHTGLEIDARVDGRTLRVISYLPPTAVQFTPKDGVNVGEISIHATLRDSDGKLVGGRTLLAKDIGLRFNAAQIDGMRKSDNLEIPLEAEAPKAGTYLLTVVVRASGGWVGARSTAIAVSRDGRW